MNEEEEPKNSGEINPDALEAVFEEEILVEESETFFVEDEDEDAGVDIAFQANDEGYW